MKKICGNNKIKNNETNTQILYRLLLYLQRFNQLLRIAENKALLKDVEIVSVDMIDHENEAITTKYKVTNPPCLVFLKDGVQVSKVNGFKAIAKTELLEHHLNKMK